MPRPRFDKLPPERQATILDAATVEFATAGYENASLNRIIERAELSKGATYYYFDGKEDLYLTVLVLARRAQALEPGFWLRRVMRGFH